MYIDVKKLTPENAAPLMLTDPIEPVKKIRIVRDETEAEPEPQELTAEQVSKLFQEVSRRVYGTGQG